MSKKLIPFELWLKKGVSSFSLMQIQFDFLGVRCYYPPRSVLAFLIAIAFADNNAHYTVCFCHRLICGSRGETYISETM